MFIKEPKITDNKYTRGVCGFITGSKNYTGSAVLNTKSAYRAGAGIVFYYGDSYKEVVLSMPEIVTSKKIKLNSKINCLCIGSGNPPINYIKKGFDFAVKNKIPIVADASAMDYAAKSNFRYNQFVMLPHMGEFKKLNGYKNGITVLKGYNTQIFNESKTKKTVCSMGTPWMATAGCGDVLSGIMCALIATNGFSFKVIVDAVLLHQKASQKATQNGVPIIATDIIDNIKNL